MVIYVKGPALAQIQRGEKRATVRLWKTCNLAAGSVLDFNGRVRCIVTEVERTTLDALTHVEARLAGYPNAAELRRALLALYPHATPVSSCVVLHFTSPTE